MQSYRGWRVPSSKTHFVTARCSWREARQTRLEKSRSWKKKFACMEDDSCFGYHQRGSQLSKKTRHRPENEISIDAHLDTLFASIQIFEARFISKREAQRYFTRQKTFFILGRSSNLSLRFVNRWTKSKFHFFDMH